MHELRKNKELERVYESIKNGSAREQFQDKWAPVIVKELRQIKKLEPSFGSIKIGYTLVIFSFLSLGILTACVSETKTVASDNPYVPVASSANVVPNLRLTASGVGSINANTAYSSKSIAAALPGYRIDTVQATSNGKVAWILAAFGKDGLQMLRFENAKGKVGAIHVVSEGIPGPGNIHVGITYRAAGAGRMQCKAGTRTWIGMAVCKGRDSHITYVFAPSEYLGEPGKLPPRDVLNASRLVRMVWRKAS